MKLRQFQITNFRSVNDSGPVTVGHLTTLVGRNESGKSNLLLGLRTLNPPNGRKDLNPIKDFPRHRRLNECKDSTPVVRTIWELDTDEQATLAQTFPRAAGVTNVEIGRCYKATPLSVTFLNLDPIAFDTATNAARTEEIRAGIEGKAAELEATLKGPLRDALSQLANSGTTHQKAHAWAKAASPTLVALRSALAAAQVNLVDGGATALEEMEELAASITTDGEARKQAYEWVVGKVPVFVFVDEYPELPGHQDIAAYLKRRDNNQATESDKNFARMCKVAELNPQHLQDLHTSGDHETRAQLANRSGAVVTSELRRLWKDRPLKVRFGLDAHHLDTLISDPNAVYDVEVNLNERSRGLRWFFSFYITFAADTADGGAAANAILLLDEPGLFLHALSQGDLLRHFASDFSNQIIYTTHSPFMVPTENLDAIRTVNISQDDGTTVSDTPTGDARTLFPLQSALGYSLSQSLFVGTDNLIVEGVTDFWMLASVSAYLEGIGGGGLPKDLTITPAGGAQKIGYLVALLTSERLRVIVLLDAEKQAKATRAELVKSKLIRDDRVLFVSSAFPSASAPPEADIEDLLSEAVFDALVRESYAADLGGKTLSLNGSIPRIVKRYEQAFAALGLEFHKTRPARLFLSKMATDPAAMMPTDSVERFQALFQHIAGAYERGRATPVTPFA